MNEFETRCLSCIYKDSSPSEGWCYLFTSPPLSKCEKYIVSIVDINKDLKYLEDNFPDKFSN